MMTGPVPKTISAYLARIPAKQRSMLRKIRDAIKAAAPKAEEVISYQMPAFKQGRAFVYFAAFKEHYSLFVPALNRMKKFEKELAGFYKKGATIHFSDEKPIPLSLIKKLVKWAVAEETARAAKKKK
jgi:uncharacterized protein YdhG (YjbR/CyaY superfamily)